jgi:hypothetical protein
VHQRERAALVGTFRPISAKSNLGLVAWTVVKHVRPDRGDVAGALGLSHGCKRRTKGVVQYRRHLANAPHSKFGRRHLSP